MKPLTVELEKGRKRQFQSIGWKTPGAGDYRRHFYALSDDGRPLVISLNIAMPDYYDPFNRAKTVFIGEPFPEAVCVEISRCRLLPPPCYQSREEIEGQQPGWPIFEPWRAIYNKVHGESLWLQPSNDGPLQLRLDQWLTAMRDAYQAEVDAWLKAINEVKSATLQEIGFESEEQRSKRLDELQEQLAMVESEDPIEGMPCKGRLKLTLEAVRLGHEGIRDTWMHEDWATRHGEDLGLMKKERRVFWQWLEKHTGTPARIVNMSLGEKFNGIIAPEFGDKFENNPKFLEACASVRYRARFADNANTVVYLADCELLEELSARELDEVGKLKPENKPATSAALPDTSITKLLPAPSLAAQYEFENIHGTEWRKAGPQMVRRRQLAEYYRTTKDASGFRDLLESHKERAYYPVKKIVQVLEAVNQKSKIPVAAWFDMTDWVNDWRPNSAPNWVHPGKHSESIRANQG